MLLLQSTRLPSLCNAPNFAGEQRALAYEVFLTYQKHKRLQGRYDNGDAVAQLYRQLAQQGYRGVPIHSLYRQAPCRAGLPAPRMPRACVFVRVRCACFAWSSSQMLTCGLDHSLGRHRPPLTPLDRLHPFLPLLFFKTEMKCRTLRRRSCCWT